MKITISVLLVLLPLTASAFDFQNMDQAGMQAMMQNMQKMQNCMANIDQNELEKLQARSEEFATSIKSLCKQGKRAEAQEKAMAYSKQFVNDKTMKAMQKCTDMAKDMMPVDTSMMFSEEEIEKGNAGHVCDSIND